MRRGWLLIALAVTGCDFDRSGTLGDDGDNEPLPPAVGGCSAPASLTGDLRLCLDFEDAMPMSIALDGSGLDHDAAVTAVGAVTRTPPDNVAEQAVRLSGASRLHIDDTPDLDLADAVTVEMFVAMDPIMLGQRYWMLDNSGQYSMSYGSDGEVECGINNLETTVDSGPVASIVDTQWHHVACTYDRKQLRVYIDGSLTDCKDANKQLVATTGGTTIGARTNGLELEHFLGSLDDVRVHARALTPAEVCRAAGNPSCVATCPPKDGRGGEDGPDGPGPGGS